MINYKTAHLTSKSIESIKKYSSGFSYEIIVVDNSNDTDEYKRLIELCPNETILAPCMNLGFGQGNNFGSRVASGNYLLFLNTDTLLINNAVKEMLVFLDKNKAVGAVGANLYKPNMQPNHSFFLKEKNTINELSFFSYKNVIKKTVSGKRPDFNYTNKPLEINGYVCGASLMIEKELFNKIGGFDKEIFMYAEEALLCYRIRNEFNRKIYNIPTAKIIHYEGASTGGQISEHSAQMRIDGNYVYYTKAFSREIANEYLSKMRLLYIKKYYLFRIIRSKKCKTYENYIKAIDRKIQCI